MRRGRTMLTRVAVVAMLAGTLLAVTAGSAHADTLTPRACDSLVTGDYVRRLNVCVRGWYDTSGLATRSVVEMHTYKWVDSPIPGWVDSRSQSITIETASTIRDDGNDITESAWGQSITQNCRVNGPGGSVGCSVPNTVRVAFYGPEWFAGYGSSWVTASYYVSWRDDRGVPHPRRPLHIGSPPWYI